MGEYDTEPQDKAIADLPDPTARLPLLRGQQALPPEASTLKDEPISTFEANNGIPYIAKALGYNQNIKIDPVVEMKAKAIDEYIRAEMANGKMPDSAVNYKTILARMLQNVGEPVQQAVRQGSIGKLLNNLFMQVSFSNGKSSDSFYKDFSQRHLQQRATSLMAELGNVLKAIKN